MEPKLLRPEEAAEILNLSKSFVYQLVRRGELNAVRISKSVRFRQQDLDAFIAAKVILKDQQPGLPTH